MTRLLKSENTIVQNQKKNLKEQYDFYKKLYTSNLDARFLYENNTDVKLTEEDKNELE